MAMRYSLSPTQSFRLKRFEPDQATEVICFLAEKEGLEYDRKFISEMVRQELADTEDGLISPVDVQVLARMIQRQTVQEGRAFNRSTFQKLGGVEGLLDRCARGVDQWKPGRMIRRLMTSERSSMKQVISARYQPTLPIPL